MEKANRSDVTRFHDEGIYIPKRLVYIGSETNDDDLAESGCDYLMAERAVKNLAILEAMSRKPITIIMNNVGGDEYHGFAIYDAIRACRSKTTIKIFGHAMSMGSIILQAAGKRLISPTSRQMIHYGTWGVHDHAKTSQQWAREGLRIDQWMEKMYLAKIHQKNPGFSLRQLKKLLDHDTFLTAKESIDLGLADGYAERLVD